MSSLKEGAISHHIQHNTCHQVGAQCLLFLTEDDRDLKPMSSSLIFSPVFPSLVMLSLACWKVIVLATIVHTSIC